MENEKPLDPLDTPEAAPILRLIEAAKNGETIVENCFYCQQPIKVESFENVSFKFNCPCGKTDGFLSGI